MTPERWQRLEVLYHAVCARAPDQRAAFLAEACGDDAALRREVESLLHESPSAAAFLVASAMVPAAQPTALMPGRLLGGYRVHSLLGRGGMGEVYRARDETLARDVAIKILPAAFTLHGDRLARLEREARMLGALNHQNICAIYGFEEVEGINFLVLELIEGETLADKLAAGSRSTSRAGLPLSEALTILRQVTNALEAAHEKGIIHRDLKPANIKITPDGTVKVLDFGLAKIVGEAAGPSLTHAPLDSDERLRAPRLLGTPSYMSPEQARGLTVDRQSDIWAAGCVLYETLTGQRAFAGETVSDTIAMILEREPDWHALPASTPISIRRLLSRCLSKDRKTRIRDIGDVGLEIDEAASARLATPGSSGAVPVVRLTRWLPWIAGAGAAVTIAIWTMRPARPPADPFANARFSLITDWDGVEGAAEVSPDGQFVAFLADRAGQFDVWWSQIGSEQFSNRTLDRPPMIAPGIILRSLGFSGDGAHIWFSASGDPGGAKVLIPQTGGPARGFLGEGTASPSWSPDGARLVFAETGNADALLIAGRSGADAVPISIAGLDISAAQPAQHNHNPVWSPDGAWIYFLRGPEPTGDMDIWRVRPAGGTAERLTALHTDINFLAALDARTLVYVARASDRSGPWLWTLDVSTRVPRRVVSGLEQYTSVSVSRDGRRVVVTRANPTASLWRVPITVGIARESEAHPLPMTTARALAPRFAGTTLFYLSGPGSGDSLLRARDGQTAVVWRSADGALSEPPAISRDGRFVAVIVRRDGKRRLTMMSADGTNARTLAPSLDIAGAAGQGTTDWSPDGKWIVTGGSDQNGPALFLVPVDGGVPVRLVAGVAVNPVWSPDGTLIIYAGPLGFGGQVALRGVKPDGSTVDLPELRTRQGGYRFVPDGTGVVYLSANASLDFSLFNFAAKSHRQLTRLDNIGALRTFDITVDGKHIVFDRVRDNSDVVLIERVR